MRPHVTVPSFTYNESVTHFGESSASQSKDVSRKPMGWSLTFQKREESREQVITVEMQSSTCDMHPLLDQLLEHFRNNGNNKQAPITASNIQEPQPAQIPLVVTTQLVNHQKNGSEDQSAVMMQRQIVKASQTLASQQLIPFASINRQSTHARVQAQGSIENMAAAVRTPLTPAPVVGVEHGYPINDLEKALMEQENNIQKHEEYITNFEGYLKGQTGDIEELQRNPFVDDYGDGDTLDSSVSAMDKLKETLKRGRDYLADQRSGIEQQRKTLQKQREALAKLKVAMVEPLGNRDSYISFVILIPIFISIFIFINGFSNSKPNSAPVHFF